MSKHITQIADRYTADIIAEFETEEWHTPHTIIFYASGRYSPTMQVSKWVPDDYVTLEPAPICPAEFCDEQFLATITALPDLEREFDERFCVQDNGMIYETLEDWRAKRDRLLYRART